MIMRKELEDRLIGFAIMVFKTFENVNKNSTIDYFRQQIVRSASSAALNYGEAQGAESKKDFIHKISIVLKELRETNVNLKILSGIDSFTDKNSLASLLNESQELVAIFFSMIRTAKANEKQNM